MSNFDPIFQSAGQQFGVDPNMLRAIAMQESSMDPQAVNPDGGASGLMGFTPANAKAYGIDPLKPEQAIPAAAKMFAESLQRSGGDLQLAVADHFAGPNPSNHGPKTAQYIKDVASKFATFSGGQPAQSGPSVDAWLSGAPAATSESETSTGPNVDDWIGQPSQAGNGTPARTFEYIDDTNNPNKTVSDLRFEVKGTANTPQNPQQPSAVDQIGHQIGLTARAGMTGLAGLPNMLGDAANSAINLGIKGINSGIKAVVPMNLSDTVTGDSRFQIPELQLPSQATQELMDKAGISQPQNATERVVQNVASSMAGVSPSVALGKFLAKSASPVTTAIGTGLQQLPGMQLTGAAGAGAGGGIARESGAGPMTQMGAALLGGAAGAVAPSAGLAMARAPRALVDNAVGVVQPITNPQAFVGKQLAQALGRDAGVTAENIRNIPEYVPGSKPTSAQAAPSPLLVATEKNEANSNPSFKIALNQREADNNAARWKALNGVSLTQEELEAAKKSRSEITRPMYEEAHKNTANVGAAFMKYAQIPEVQEAMQRANSAAALDAAAKRGVAPVWPTPESKAINGAALDYTSRALGDMANEAMRAGSNSRAASLLELQKNIQGWTERYIPGVAEAASDYRSLSSPINTMEAGQQISGALGTRAMDSNGLPQIQLSTYKSALVQALKKQEYGIDPGALQSLQGIGQDLQRSTISNSLKSPGSDTAYNIAANGWLGKQIYGKEFEGASMLGRGISALGATVTGHPMVGMGIMAGGKKLGQTVGDNLTKELQNLLLNPEALLPYLDKTGKVTPQAIAAALKNNVRQGAVGAAVTNP